MKFVVKADHVCAQDVCVNTSGLRGGIFVSETTAGTVLCNNVFTSKCYNWGDFSFETVDWFLNFVENFFEHMDKDEKCIIFLVHLGIKILCSN